MTTARTTELDAWVNRRHAEGYGALALLKRIAAHGTIGSDGAGGRRRMTIPAADLLLTLTGRAGAGNNDARRALVDVLRWHYGYSSGPAPVLSIGTLTAQDIAWVQRRAWGLVNEHRPQRLPLNDRPAT